MHRKFLSTRLSTYFAKQRVSRGISVGSTFDSGLRLDTCVDERTGKQTGGNYVLRERHKEKAKQQTVGHFQRLFYDM